MKIKEVCEKTGLTDRTIRYYIECGLLTPSNKENYAGRKQFAFTREDVERLETIKLLRGAGFSVEQIKRLFNSRSSREVVSERLQELKGDRERSERLYETLKKADMDREVSVEELAIIVSTNPVVTIEEAAEPPKERSQKFKENVAFVYVLLLGCAVYGIVALALFFGGLSWIELHIPFLPLWILLLLVGYFLCRQSLWVRSAVTIGICVVMLLPTAVAVIIGEPKELDAAGYAIINEIPWDQEAFLLKHGFERVEDNAWIYENDTYSPTFPYPTGYYEYSSLWVRVWDAESDDIELTTYHRRYGDAYVDEWVEPKYGNVFEKWLLLPRYIERRYSIIIDGYVVDVWEANYEDRRVNYFEEFLKELSATL